MFNRNIDARFNVRELQTLRSRSFAIGGLLATIALTIHAGARADWCAEYSYGARTCGFSTYAQCLATVSGVGGFCNGTSDAPNPGSSDRKRTRKATTEAKSKPAPEKAQAVREQPKPATGAQTQSYPVPAPAGVAAQAAANAARNFANARQLILGGQYEAGGAAMRALNLDNEPDVAAYIGLAQRKLGRIDEAKLWYDRALAADPNHKLTLSFYGMLRTEQGDLPGARGDLQKIKDICGNTTCNEYVGLAGVIAAKTH